MDDRKKLDGRKRGRSKTDGGVWMIGREKGVEQAEEGG